MLTHSDVTHTTILSPLHPSICISRHLRLIRTDRFCWSCQHDIAYFDSGEDARVILNGVTNKSPYHIISCRTVSVSYKSPGC